MGCGSGIQGLICAMQGAEHVDMVDISHSALNCSKQNVETYNLTSKINVFESNLFDNIQNRYDLIIFNPPFLQSSEIELESGLMRKVKTIEPMIFYRGNIEEFFANFSNYLHDPNSLLIMPFFDINDNINNPKKYAINGEFPFETYQIDEKRFICTIHPRGKNA
jgi:tRNA1(Val) A37 N6-methylase TrmN6